MAAIMYMSYLLDKGSYLAQLINCTELVLPDVWVLEYVKHMLKCHAFSLSCKRFIKT